jgi:hypothetical protein
MLPLEETREFEQGVLLFLASICKSIMISIKGSIYNVGSYARIY